MTQPASNACLNCGRPEAQIPLLGWRYQGRELWICPDCLPLLIHKRDQVMVKWFPSGEKPAPAAGGGSE